MGRGKPGFRPATNAADAEILAATARQLARFELPEAIIRVPSIQRSAAGKTDCD